MVQLVIKGCEFDPAHAKDVIFGDGFRMELDQAIELAMGGIEFWAAEADGSAAKVSVEKNEYGELILKTEPSARAANHFGEICAPPIVHRRYRAEAHHTPVQIHHGYAVAA